MATQQTDQITGWGETLAVKAPCRVATTASILLEGLLTVDGIVLIDQDRVLVKDQADPALNGIYIVSTGQWQRARDFDSFRDITTGTRIGVNVGTVNGGNEFRISSPHPIAVNDDPIVFTRSDFASEAVAAAEEARGYRDEAADYAALARNDMITERFAGDGVTSVFNLAYDPGSKANVELVIDGVQQLFDEFTVVGQVLTTGGVPPGNGIRKNINVRYAYRIDTGVPGFATVGVDQIDPDQTEDLLDLLDAYSKDDVDTLIAASLALPGHANGLSLATNASDASNDIDIATGAAASDGSPAVLMTLASALTKRMDAAWAVGTGNGGWLDGGGMPNGTGHVYLIQRTDTGVVDVAASASLTPTLPAGYTRKRRIGSIIRLSGANLAFDQMGTGRERVTRLRTSVANVNAVASQGAAAVTRNLTVPTGTRVMSIATYGITSSPGAGDILYVSSFDQADDAPVNGNVQVRTTTADVSFSTLEIPTNTSGQVRTRQNGGGSQEFLTIITRGWKDFI